MPRQHKKKKSGFERPQVVALGLMGVGLLVLGVLAIFLMPKAGTTNQPAEQSSSVPATVDYAAPQFDLQDLQGQAVSLADYQGQVILVNNWATWCPPCKAEMPTLQAFYNDHHKQNFTIIGIEAGEPATAVAQFVKDHSLTFPVWPDTGQKSILAFRNQNLPNSYVIDRTGKVRLAWTGAISRKMLEDYVTPLLEE
jgi:cytochrome c biogenesis protein CcmG, thiol:disulfide interchange protein DsbE